MYSIIARQVPPCPSGSEPCPINTSRIDGVRQGPVDFLGANGMGPAITEIKDERKLCTRAPHQLAQQRNRVFLVRRLWTRFPPGEQLVPHFVSLSRTQFLFLYLAASFFKLLFGIRTDPVIMCPIVATLDRKHACVRDHPNTQRMWPASKSRGVSLAVSTRRQIGAST